ncbi:phage portal protein, partial [Oxalobacter sp. OttesenSCG-928-P03]|nr:phage portal protein [Oxalobacter sp. OttesenSCG-928-P03]
MTKTDQRTLKGLVTRRHPEYAALVAHWQFMKSCYDGGREWFSDNIFKYLKEGESEFKDRLERCYRFNHTREVVDLVNKYIFKMEIARSKDAPSYVQDFWKGTTLNGLPIKDYMKHISERTSIYGRIWIVVDNNNTGEIRTVADEKRANVRVHSYTVSPDNVCDLSYDEKGELNWILIHEQERDDEDPLNSTGDVIDRFRLWERNQWTLFRLKKDGGSKPESRFALTTNESLAAMDTDKVLNGYTVDVDGPHAHTFGRVPVFPADNIVSSEPYKAPALIDDVAYLDRAVANYLSNLDAIIQDQTFSQLVIPAQAIADTGNTKDALIEMGTNRILSYDASGGGKPEYISPDVKQADLILRVVNKIINEIYHSVGLAGERTKEDNAMGIDNSSGVAKAYDFERVNSLLISKADS